MLPLPEPVQTCSLGEPSLLTIQGFSFPPTHVRPHPHPHPPPHTQLAPQHVQTCSLGSHHTRIPLSFRSRLESGRLIFNGNISRYLNLSALISVIEMSLFLTGKTKVSARNLLHKHFHYYQSDQD